MPHIKDQFQEERLKAIRELEKRGKDAFLPESAWGLDLSVLERAKLGRPVKTSYRRELRELLDLGINPFDFDALDKHAMGLLPSRRKFLRRALRLVLLEHEGSVKADPTPDSPAAAQELVMRLDVMRERRKAGSVKKKHIHLTTEQVWEITSLCGDDLEGKRDWIILGLLLGAGLHRAELVEITFDALKQEETKTGEVREVLAIKGHGANDRTVPLSRLLAKRLREWQEIVGGGRIARAYNNKRLRASFSAESIFYLVRKYGEMIGIPKLSADDLRRTYAHLAYDAGIPVEQIKELLGHDSIRTTERYLDLSPGLDDIDGEFVPLAGH